MTCNCNLRKIGKKLKSSIEWTKRTDTGTNTSSQSATIRGSADLTRKPIWSVIMNETITNMKNFVMAFCYTGHFSAFHPHQIGQEQHADTGDSCTKNKLLGSQPTHKPGIGPYTTECSQVESPKPSISCTRTSVLVSRRLLPMQIYKSQLYA